MGLLDIAYQLGKGVAVGAAKKKAVSYVAEKNAEFQQAAKDPFAKARTPKYEGLSLEKAPAKAVASGTATVTPVFGSATERRKKELIAQTARYGKEGAGVFVRPSVMEEDDEKTKYLKKVDEALVKSLKGLGLVNPEKEASSLILDVPGKAVRSFFDGVFMGIPEAVGKYKGIGSEPVTAYGKHVEKSFAPLSKTLETTAGVAGMFAGYGAVSRSVSKVLTKIPKFSAFAQPLAKAASKKERAKRFLFYGGAANLTEETIDATIRTLSGQNYTSTDFALGMTLGGVFEGVAHFNTKNLRDIFRKTPEKAKKELGAQIETFAKNNDRAPSGEELVGIMGQVKVGAVNMRQVFEDSSFFKEARMLGYKPKSFESFAEQQAKRVPDAAGAAPEDPLIQEAKKYKSAEEFVNSPNVKTIGTPGGRQKSYFKQSVELADLELHNQNLKLAQENVLAGEKAITKTPIVVGMDIDTGKLTLFDGYHRYVQNKGEGVVDAYIQPTKNGEFLELTDIWNKANKATPEASLIQEAKKYKSAEEFVKGQGTLVYRGGVDLSKEKITNAGISVSKGKNVAEDFVKQKGGKVEELVISPNAKIVDYSDVPDVKFKNLNDYSPELDVSNKQIWKDLEVEYKKAVNWAEENGYDGVKLPLEGETRIINKNIIKTKAQLTDIWNNANKPSSYGAQAFPDVMPSMKSKGKFAQMSDAKGTDALPPHQEKVVKENATYLEETFKFKERKTYKTFQKTKDLAKELKLKIRKSPERYYEEIHNKETVERAKKIVSGDAAEVINKLHKEEFSADNVAAAELLIKKYNQAGKYDLAADLAETLFRKATTGGQAIQAMSMLSRLSADGILAQANKVLKKAKEAGKKMPDKLPKGLADEFYQRAKKIESMPDSRQKLMETALLQRDIAELVPTSIARKLSTFQTMAQLLNLKTMGRNLLGNTVFQGLERTSRRLGAMLDVPFSWITGERSVMPVSFKEQLKGAKKGAIEGAQETWHGVDLSGNNTQYDLANLSQYGRTFKKGILGRMELAMSLSLRVPDRAFFEASKRSTIDELARISAKNKKLKGKEALEHIAKLKKEPTEDMLETASQKGLYDTFQDKNKTTEAFQGIKNILNYVGFGDGEIRFGLGDLVLKYAKTPANLLNRSVAYSPLGFVKAATANTQRGAVEAGSRAIVGTSIMAIGYKLAALGVVTSSYEKDADVRALQTLEGEGANRINVSALKRWVLSGFDDRAATTKENDKISTYDWVQPIAGSFAAGAETFKKMKTKLGTKEFNFNSAEDLFDVLSVGVQSTLYGVDALFDQPLVSGLKRTLSNKDISQMLSEPAASLPSSFTPTIVSQIRQYVDNVARETYDPNFMQQGLNRALNKIPGLHQLLPERKTVWGESAEIYQNQGNGLFNVFLNPSFITNKKADPKNDFLLKLRAETGRADFLPTVAPKQIQVGSKGKADLSADEYNKYQETTGKLFAKQFDHILVQKEFTEMLPEDQAKELRGALDEIRDHAKGEFYLNRLKSENKKSRKNAEKFYNELTDSQYRLLEDYAKRKKP